MPKILAHCYSTISNMRRYGQQLQKFILLFYLLFLSPHHRYLSLSVFSSMSSLSSLSSLFLFHNTPITKGHHHSTPPIIYLPCLASCSFLLLFFPFFFFSFSFFGCGLMGGFGWANHHPPRSTIHPTLSDRQSLMPIFVFFFFVFVFLWWWFCVMLWWF